MDLSLQGSQINLVSRNKAKTTSIKYPTLRPGSASSLRSKTRSPFLRRPQSADITRSFENISHFVKNKKYLSISSSNLLKILLDDPVKRPWLCRDSNDSRPPSRRFCGSVEESIEESTDSHSSVMFRRPQSAILKSKTPKATAKVRPSSSSMESKSSDWKADLPGRVSFGKSQNFEIDLSDCDNDKQSCCKGEMVSSPNKKSVHFGNSSHVHEETFEYPKCPSENCSCSTRSSSIASMPDLTTAVANDEDNTLIQKFKEVSRDTSPPVMESKTFNNEKQNNFTLSEHMNSSKNPVVELYKQTKINAIEDMRKSPPLNLDQEEPNSVVNTYLKVSSSPITTRKKTNIVIENIVKPSVRKPPMRNRRSKSASSEQRMVESKALKKTGTYACLREDSNLSEFNIDKVDSWMSLEKKPEGPPKRVIANYENFSKLVDDTNKIYRRNDTPESTTSTSTEKSDNENSQDDSTYDEIVSVIKEIEEEKQKENNAEMCDPEFKLNELLKKSEIIPLPSEKSPDKLESILNYLDDVESSCDKAIMETRRSIPESNRSEIEFVIEPDITEDVPKISELLTQTSHQLARRVIALTLRANELSNALLLSKEHVVQVKSEKQKGIRIEKQLAMTKIKEQKKHFEGVVSRHQEFIEQLLKDKGSLCDKVAALTRRLESQNQAWEHKLETEVTRVKETAVAGEKIRRERWVRENTKKIKELTVKGLEAEINKMNSEHQKQIAELKRQHQESLLQALDEARMKHEHVENDIRKSCAEDRESVIEKERKAIRDRFDRQLQEERQQFEVQKAKILEESSAEVEKLRSELRKYEKDFIQKKQDILSEKDEEITHLQNELLEKMNKQEEKYENRINAIEKQYQADFAIWKQEYENACKLRDVENENNIRQHYRNERDRQIDAIVARMDSESEKAHEDFESKMLKLKEKYEEDLKEFEAMEKSLRDKFNETRGKLAESDAQVKNYGAEIKQLEIELEHSKKMCNEFLSEKEQIKENARNEVQNEIVNLKLERDNEIQKIYKRVQQAIEKKDSTIQLIQKENVSMRERCIKLEAIIRQQRKDYCVK